MASQGNTRYKTRYQDKAPRQDTMTHQQGRQQARARHHQERHDKTRKTVTVNYVPVLFFSSYILIQILVFSGYYNIGTKDRRQKAWTVVAKVSHLYCSLCYVFFTNF